MKTLLIKIKNLYPYFLLIGIYFFFINIEAQRDRSIHENKGDVITSQMKSNNNTDDLNLTISIPVIPFEN